MRSLRVLTPVAVILCSSGCGYVHFGRLPQAKSDPVLENAYMDLAIQQKVLKQELALARKESETLRAALDRTGASAAPAAEATQRLEETTRELAALRVSYAKLQAERSGPSAATDANLTKVATLEDENAQLRRQLDTARTENAALAEKLKSSVTETEQAHIALTQLSGDLVSQKEARARAEQATVALRAQLAAVMARAGRADDSAAPSTAPSAPPALVDATPDATRAPPSGNPLLALRETKAPPSEPAAVAEIRTNLSRARQAANAVASGAEPSPAASAEPSPPATPSTTSTPAAAPSTDAKPAAAPRTYTVQLGDTLEKISLRFYGVPDQWSKIYDANSAQLVSGQGLKAGMTINIP